MASGVGATRQRRDRLRGELPGELRELLQGPGDSRRRLAPAPARAVPAQEIEGARALDQAVRPTPLHLGRVLEVDLAPAGARFVAKEHRFEQEPAAPRAEGPVADLEGSSPAPFFRPTHIRFYIELLPLR